MGDDIVASALWFSSALPTAHAQPAQAPEARAIASCCIKQGSIAQEPGAKVVAPGHIIGYKAPAKHSKWLPQGLHCNMNRQHVHPRDCGWSVTDMNRFTVQAVHLREVMAAPQLGCRGRIQSSSRSVQQLSSSHSHHKATPTYQPSETCPLQPRHIPLCRKSKAHATRGTLPRWLGAAAL